jgi:hypothetical protein
VDAFNTSSTSILSGGTISYSPTPTPTPTPTLVYDSVNLAVMPDYWSHPEGWCIAPPYSQYPVTWQGQQCMKISRNPTYINLAMIPNGWWGLNEIDGPVTPVSGGDHIVYRAKVWVESATILPEGGAGLYMAIDAYGSGGRITELKGAGGVDEFVDPYYPRLVAPWGSTGWVTLEMDFYIKSSYGGQAVTGIIPWFQLLHIGSYDETASAYIYGTELYINPT